MLVEVYYAFGNREVVRIRDVIEKIKNEAQDL